MKWSITMVRFLLLAITTVSCVEPLPPVISRAAVPLETQAPAAPAYILAFHWPKTVCTIRPCRSEYVQTMPQNFRLHGLWPTPLNYFGTIENCPGPDFSVNALNFIHRPLLVYWPSLLEPENTFWGREWSKHGTCSGLSQFQYFDRGLDLSIAYSANLLTALARSNIHPGDGNITPQRIRNAIRTNIRVLCRVACAVGPRNTTYLLEIRLCLDGNFTLRNCPENNWFTPNCGTANKIIAFPVATSGYKTAQREELAYI